jgi:LPXTG-motif cell wall-anchored protein
MAAKAQAVVIIIIIVITFAAPNYVNGPLVGQDGWQAHSGAGNKAIAVNAGSITLTQSSGSGEDVNKRWFVGQDTTVKTYAAFNLNIPGGTLGGADYFAHFRPAGNDSNNFVTRVHVALGSNASQYTVGVSSGSTASTTLVNWPTELVVGTTYKIAMAYDPTTGDSKLWVDPNPNLGESAPSVTSPGTPAIRVRSLESFAFRQSSPTGGANFTERITDLAVSSEFKGLFSFSKDVPSTGTWGLAALGLALALAGSAFALRRRTNA